MRALLAAAALALGLAAPAQAQYYYQLSYDSSVGTATLRMAGGFYVTKSSKVAEGDYLNKIFEVDTHYGVTVSTGFTLKGTSSMTVQGAFLSTGTASFTGARGVDVTYEARAGSFTATALSSAPLLNTSTISAPGDLNVYTSGGNQVMKLTSVGMLGSTDAAFADSTLGTLDLYESTGGDLYLRRYDTSVAAGDTIGSIVFRDRDSSTGGSSDKATYKVTAYGTWGSNNTMEVAHQFQLKRPGVSLADYMVISTTGTLITGYPGFTADTTVACDTCALQVAGHASVTGNLTASSAAFHGNGASSPFVVTASSGIRMNSGAFELGSGGFIRFSDGTTQLSAATASGDTTNSGNVTMSGHNTWVNTSSVTFSSQTIVNGTWAIVDSTTPTGGVASWTSTFDTDLSTSMSLELDFTVTATSNDGDLYIRFNGDSGNNYYWGLSLITDNGAGPGSDSGGGATSRCNLHRATYFDSADTVQGKVRCHTYPNASMKVMCTVEATITSNALARGEGANGICRYLGSASITSITIGRTAGTMYGRATRILLRTN